MPSNMPNKTASPPQTTDTPRTPTHSNRRINPATVMKKLTDLGNYLSNPDIAMKVAFIAGRCAADRLVPHDAVNDPQPEEVQLTLLGEVSHDGAWLSAEGAYHPGLKLNPGDNITGGKAKFKLIAPSDPKLTVFRHDLEMYIANTCAIHKAALKGKVQCSNCRDPVQNGPIHLTIRHPLIIASQINYKDVLDLTPWHPGENREQ
ncbi:hypothetical protein JB92DRAFT_3103552 [Gautieria morchelliformis]|nr:hypothetical protein JB92DRAFT_3103552 [Gautieria morchelliformis]